MQNLPKIETVEQAREVLIEMDEEQEIMAELDEWKASIKKHNVQEFSVSFADYETGLFGSDYAIWSPKWLVEEFVDLQMPESDEFEDFSELTPEIKRKILGLNAAKLYDIEVPEELQVEHAGTGPAVTEKPAADLST